MDLRYITGMMLFLAMTNLSGASDKKKHQKVKSSQTRAASLTTQNVNTGVSLNQQIGSSSLNSSVSAAANGGQFVINKSGRYFLSTDIFAAPAASRTPCIYINTSDVVLDLGGKTLTLSTSTNQKNISAIEVAANKRNITIMNGTLNGRAGTSSVYTTTGIMVNAGVSNVLIDNVHVVNFGERGFVFDTGCSAITLNNVHAANNSAAAVFAARCLTLLSCDDIIIMDSSFNKTQTTCPHSTYGIFADSCTNITLNNVQISNTTATTGYLRALWFYRCTGATCNNVRVLGSSTDSNPAYENIGIDIWKSTGCTFVNCVANDGLSTHYTTSTYGFKITNGSNSNVFINCGARNNRGGGTTAAFKLCSSHYNTFDECTAIGNGGASHLTYGFQSGLTSRSGLASEFTLSSSANTFKKCKANGNTATLGNTYGFNLVAETGSSIQSCEVKANTASGICYGIALHYNSIKNIIEYNTVYSNMGENGMYGFKDFDTDCTSLLRGNVIFGHGATFSGGNSYLTDTGNMNYMLRYAEATGQMNIQFLIKEADIANMNAFEAGSPTWFNFSILHNSFAG